MGIFLNSMLQDFQEKRFNSDKSLYSHQKSQEYNFPKYSVLQVHLSFSQ